MPNGTENLAQELRGAYPELDAIGEAADGPVYLVGGAVRDLLLGRSRSTNLDLVVLGDAAAFAGKLGGTLEHERFATAKARLGDLEVDVASARTETYARPGALPDVTTVGDLDADLARRDFTVNAMAIPIESPRLIDPHDGRADLEAGLLRILHPGSFGDDPTRALRAARYGARLGFAPEPTTERLLRETDLATISADRRDAELARIAAEPHAARGFELLARWGLVELRPDGASLAESVSELLSSPPWSGFADRSAAVLAAALGPQRGEAKLATVHPERPSRAVGLARGHDPVELALARALGAEWLERYMVEWRSVKLEIDGGDVIAAGVPEGPAVGRGLAAALARKLDGELSGREAELAAALEAAGEPTA